MQALEGPFRRSRKRAGPDDTMIIVMSDHGMPFPGAKGSSFDSGHNCPLLIARPGASEIESDAVGELVDIAPTVYDWCGTETPEGLPERSMLPTLDQAHTEGWDETFFSHTFHEVTNYYPYRVLRGRKYKYVKNLYPELTTLCRAICGRLHRASGSERGIEMMMGSRPTEAVPSSSRGKRCSTWRTIRSRRRT